MKNSRFLIFTFHKILLSFCRTEVILDDMTGFYFLLVLISTFNVMALLILEIKMNLDRLICLGASQFNQFIHFISVLQHLGVKWMGFLFLIVNR